MRERLATIEEEIAVEIDGEAFSDIQQVGHVVRAYGGKLEVGGEWVENAGGVGEFIRLHLPGATYKWAAALDDYDPDTNSHDPATDVRWEAE